MLQWNHGDHRKPGASGRAAFLPTADEERVAAPASGQAASRVPFQLRLACRFLSLGVLPGLAQGNRQFGIAQRQQVVRRRYFRPLLPWAQERGNGLGQLDARLARLVPPDQGIGQNNSANA